METTLIATAEAENNGSLYATQASIHQQTFMADEPPAYGGQDLGPTPVDFLCLSLATCKAITLRMYAQRKGWPVTAIKVKVSLVKTTGADPGQNTFYCELTLAGTLDEAQRKRLLDISKACPVQRLLSKPAEIITQLV